MAQSLSLHGVPTLGSGLVVSPPQSPRELAAAPARSKEKEAIGYQESNHQSFVAPSPGFKEKVLQAFAPFPNSFRARGPQLVLPWVTTWECFGVHPPVSSLSSYSQPSKMH